jgi:hypothetical protein
VVEVEEEVEVEVMPNSSSSLQPLGLGEPVHQLPQHQPHNLTQNKPFISSAFCLLGPLPALGVSHSVFFFITIFY